MGLCAVRLAFPIRMPSVTGQADDSGQQTPDGSCLLTATRLCRLRGSPLTTPSKRPPIPLARLGIPLSTASVQIPYGVLLITHGLAVLLGTAAALLGVAHRLSPFFAALGEY